MKKILIIIASALIGIYLLFLLLPLVVTPIINNYSDDLAKIIEESTGYKAKFGKMQFITTPKLTTGLKFNDFELLIPPGETFFSANNLKVKMSIIPLLTRKIELDSISVNKITANLKVRQDGHFLIEEYIPQQDIDKKEIVKATVELPLGFKLSDRLPNILVKDYNISFFDMLFKKSYTIAGNDLYISDFIFNKQVRAKAKGSVTLNGLEQFKYNIKIFNKIMPNITVNDLVFNNENQQENKNQNTEFFNIIDIFKALNSNQLTATVNGDITTSGTPEDLIIDGFADIENISMLVDGKKTPDSYAKIKANGQKINLDIVLNSFNNENTKVDGYIKTGKNAKVDISIASNAQINNIIRPINSIAKSFKYNDLETLNATGKIDADFNLKSNMKKVESSGYLKIPSGSINYGLYNIAVKNLNADVSFNNMLDIKNISLEILGQPLKISGTIQHNADTDILVTANNLLLKGIIAAAGQMQVLKENVFNSGTLSMDAHIKGNLSSIKPTVNMTINNVDVNNKPSGTKIILPTAKIKINSNGKTFDGNILASKLSVINPMIKLIIPESDITIGEKDININKAYIMLDNSRIDVTGKITNYISDKLKIDISANGELLAADIKKMIPKEFKDFVGTTTGKLPLQTKITGDLKSQDVTVKLTSDSNNYVSVIDADVLKNHKTIINSDIKIIDDSAKLTNTGVYVDDMNNVVAKLEGSVNKLSKSQNLNLRLSLPKTINMVIPGMKGSNMAVRGELDISGTSSEPVLKGLINIPTITIPDMDLTITNTVANLNGPILKGNGTVQTFKFGGIQAENLASEFSMKNYSVFYLNKLMGDAYNGKVSGDISYGLNDAKMAIKMTGSDLNAVKTIEGFSGIKNALSGTLGFDIDVTTKGATDTEIMKNLLGKLNFEINNGKFLNVGRFDTLLYAQNIVGNAILKAAVTAVTDTPIIQNTAEFKNIKGSMTFNNGFANLNPITVAGNLMAYYVKGTYNLLNGTTNVIILGRLDSKVVSVLGALGDLSVDTLTGYLPKFGDTTAAIINLMTSDPENENTDNIPALSTGSTNYRDFKAVFNGGLESTSSVKSFKWLSKCDTTAIDIKKEIKNSITETKQSIEDTKQQFRDAKDDIKNQINETKQQFNDAKQQLKDLKNLFKPLPAETTETSTEGTGE